ncbi:farnesyl pyrophosphate synthase-like [Leptidea sinapis]|uniref:farnesyl pyrophosphate synthase-like n=1 Tax=Leptidea sinapis TaxID=189913 RepID=UPI0021420EB7|nr:farnesyl pyrophosphate synthase-like [Leptidea sinapis]
MNPCATFSRMMSGVGRTLSKRNLNGFNLLLGRMSTNVSIPMHISREIETFQDTYPRIFDTLSKNPGIQENPKVCSWLKTVLDYNLHGGKKARGLATVSSYEILAKPENVTEEMLEISRVMGWCVEMLQAYFLMIDDIMDGAPTRRGAPCWYRRPEVGLGALNDAILVQAAMYDIIKVYCKHIPTYTNILHEFNQALFHTSMGQYLDYSMAHRNKSDYTLFTREQYSAIVKYKTSYYTYKLPVCLGMLLNNNTNKDVHQKAEKICLEIGHLFQMQDDYIDCLASEKVTGKAGTDIQEGKCSWLAVEALQRMTDAQRKVFVTCYGSHEPAHIERVKRLYEELDLTAVFRQEERDRYDAIVKQSQALPKDAGPLPDLFLKLLNLIYDRKK